MQNSIPVKLNSKHKKILLGFIFFVVLIHFLKDITQDLFGISTILDNLGNIEEDISAFPLWLEYFYHWTMVNTVIGEIVLLVLIPKYIFRSISVFEKRLIIGFLLYIPSMFFVAFLLSV